MTGTQTLIARTGLGVFSAACGLVVLQVNRLRQMRPASFDRAAKLALIASRLGFYVLIFFVLRIAARGDVMGYYFPEALQVLHGGVPYREFMTSYAPFHPYLDAAAIFVWRSPLAIILLAILCEMLLLPVWLAFARALFAEQQVRMATVLYIFSPISLQFVTIDGQDNVLIAVLLALSIYCLYRQRVVLSGVAVALGIVVLKFLPLLFLPEYVLAVPKRLRWLAGFALLLLLGYGPFALLHAQLLYPLLFEGQERTASNLPYVLEALTGLGAHPHLEDGLLLVALLVILALSARVLLHASAAVRLRVLVFSPAALTLALLLLSKKSWPPYLMLVLFPLCLLLYTGTGRTARTVAFALFSVIAIFVHSVWATIFQQAAAPEIHALLLAGDRKAQLFLLFQVLLIAGYGWLLAESTRQVVFARRYSESELPAAA